MTLRVSRSLLEAALLNMMNEEDAPVAPAGDTPANPPPPEPQAEVQLDNAGLIAKKVEELKANKAAQISAGGRTFMRQGGKFFIKDIQITTQDLLGLLSDEAKTRVEEEIKKGAQSIGVRGDEFIDPVARGASFSSEGRGLWVDLAEVPIDVVAEYVLRDSGDIPDGAAYVTGEITEIAGKHLVYRTNELAVVIPEGAKDVYIMSTQNDPNDPLGSALQLLKSVNILAEWRANPIRFYELVGTGPEVGKSFALQIDEKMKLGNFNKALKSIRTGAGKFFDFLNPFEGANIEVNFKFTELGPALVRTEVFGGKGGRIQAGGLTDKDLARLADTDYFRYENLDTPVDTEYSFKKGKKAPIEPSGLRNKAGNNYFEEEGKIKVDNAGESVNPEKDGTPKQNTLTFDYGFGRALWIYLKGYLEAKEAAPPLEATAPATPAPEPADPWKDYNEEVKRALGGGDYAALGDGYYTFDFNSGDKYVPDPADYLAIVIDALDNITDKIPKDANVNDSTAKFQIFVVGTADPVGERDSNQALSQKRAEKFFNEFKVKQLVLDKLKLLKFDDKDPAKQLVKITSLPLGEAPWSDKDATWGKDKKTYTDQIRAPLRIAKVFIGPFGAEPTAAQAPISKLLMDKASAIDSLKESVDLDPLRRQIRKILLETMRK